MISDDTQVRDIIRPHRDGGPISRLYATGEITDDTVPALGLCSSELEDQGRHEEADQVDDVLAYVVEAGNRPPVDRWIKSN
ncbi:hypothetical protein [Streptomyces anthocyanicus]|uniref:hypothetical protein n=1 Tax=Streptomyces anthocyanicus TaxID=68174 RepID=UPI003808E081